MSRLIKIYTDKEDVISKIKIQLYMDGISSISKKSYSSNHSSNQMDAAILFDLYIDNQHLNKANYIINHLFSTQ